MAQIPTTNIQLRTNIRSEYGGSSSNVSLGNYYRSVNNSANVDNSAVIPYNPKYYLDNPYYPAIGPSTNYARWQTEFRQQDAGGFWVLVPGTTLDFEWKWAGQVKGTLSIPATNSPNNPACPTSYVGGPSVSYGSTSGYFYFTPDTNYPWSGQTFTELSMGISNTFTEGLIFGVTTRMYTIIYSIWRTKAKAAGIAYYNQTVPTTGEISMGDFKNQQNP